MLPMKPVSATTGRPVAASASAPVGSSPSSVTQKVCVPSGPWTITPTRTGSPPSWAAAGGAAIASAVRIARVRIAAVRRIVM